MKMGHGQDDLLYGNNRFSDSEEDKVEIEKPPLSVEELLLLASLIKDPSRAHETPLALWREVSHIYNFSPSITLSLLFRVCFSYISIMTG